MLSSHEQINPEANDSIEKSRKTVESFIETTKTLFANENRHMDIEWEHQMNVLYGNEELLRVTKNEAYKGIPGIKEDLRVAYENGGLSELKATFIVKAVKNTNVSKMGDAAIIAFKKLIDFK
jgi:hypothetical protein